MIPGVSTKERPVIGEMAFKPSDEGDGAIAAKLSAPERILLFCLASGTE